MEEITNVGHSLEHRCISFSNFVTHTSIARCSVLQLGLTGVGLHSANVHVIVDGGYPTHLQTTFAKSPFCTNNNLFSHSNDGRAEESGDGQSQVCISMGHK